MKNLKRIFLLLTLAFIASKVLLSDFDLTANKNINPIVTIASK